MRLRFARTISFRLAVLYVGLFAVSTVLLFGIVFWIASVGMRDQLQLALESEMASFEAESATNPSSELATDIDRRLASAVPQPFFYSLRDPSRREIAGNLAGVAEFEGRRELPALTASGGRAAADEVDHVLLALGRRLPDGGHLTVAIDTFRLQEARESMVHAFAWAAAATLLLAITGGVVLSHGFVRRVDDINRTMRSIMEGDLSMRIRLAGTGDELDRLGGNLNEMLDRLQALMEDLRQVSNDIAHDLRTPLSRLRQRLEEARLEAQSTEDYERAVDQAVEDVDAVLSTFSALLRIAQIESGTRRSNFADLDLSALLAGLTQTYAAVAEDAGKSLTANLAPEVHVRGDRELLTQMFVNLIENALRHTPPGAHIGIAASAGAAGPVAEISDDGPGIPEAERAGIFKRFYRLEASRTMPGSGLGLTLARAVADLHGAHVELADNRPGLKVRLQFAGQTPG